MASVSGYPTVVSRHYQLKQSKLGLGFEETSKSARLPPNHRLRRCSLVYCSGYRPTGMGIEALATGTGGMSSSPWDEKPYELLPGGKRSYLDEQDVVSFLDPPKELIPLDPDSYNPASYLWKKIGDIPEERRCRLLSVLKPSLIPRVWEVVGTRYQDAKLAKRSSSPLLSLEDDAVEMQEFWSCRTSEGPLPLSWLNDFKKALFRGKDGGTYGRILPGGPIGAGLAKLYSPLYFTARQAVEVMSTEQPCDIAYDFGDGLFLNLKDFPEGFPQPAKHPWPFNDHLVIYIRHVGPGVSVGQAWQEGKELNQVPKKFCGDILMVKDYFVVNS
ncbi:hypothetical protein J5N97_003299 [Dioscorea zingiberensis]|uniref:Uncharacterized protein n=1 Tax=Dioscorea zingiberensis TaxID=325984 RepID=A0A9D5D4F7_9LILI|nr:hypothetical protein J5N97_003299 [Dioscorea zingiberensis]